MYLSWQPAVPLLLCMRLCRRTMRISLRIIHMHAHVHAHASSVSSSDRMVFNVGSTCTAAPSASIQQENMLFLTPHMHARPRVDVLSNPASHAYSKKKIQHMHMHVNPQHNENKFKKVWSLDVSPAGSQVLPLVKRRVMILNLFFFCLFRSRLRRGAGT